MQTKTKQVAIGKESLITIKITCPYKHEQVIIHLKIKTFKHSQSQKNIIDKKNKMKIIYIDYERIVK